MVDRILSLEAKLIERGHVMSALLGSCAAIILAAPAMIMQSNGLLSLPLVLYAPFHFWLIATGLLVIFSEPYRDRIVGPVTHGFIEAWFKRFFSPFGFLCMGFFFTLTLAISLVPIA